MTRQALMTALAVAGFAALGAEPALAHHLMGGAVPQTFAQGLLSGLAHPVIGPDHLAFMLAMGVAAPFVPGGVLVGACFVLASMIGVVVHTMSIGVPLAELLVALTVVAAGATFAFGVATRPAVWIALAAVAGLAHGYAFGESVVGAERGVLGAYMAGLAVVTTAIVTGVSVATRSLLGPTGAGHPRIRFAGWAFCAVGAALSAFALAAVA